VVEGFAAQPLLGPVEIDFQVLPLLNGYIVIHSKQYI
jgi:hypothetical protein